MPHARAIAAALASLCALVGTPQAMASVLPAAIKGRDLGRAGYVLLSGDGSFAVTQDPHGRTPALLDLREGTKRFRLSHAQWSNPVISSDGTTVAYTTCTFPQRKPKCR